MMVMFTVRDASINGDGRCPGNRQPNDDDQATAPLCEGPWSGSSSSFLPGAHDRPVPSRSMEASTGITVCVHHAFSPEKLSPEKRSVPCKNAWCIDFLQ